MITGSDTAARADIAFLKQLGEQYGFKVETVSGIRVNDTVVSSTAIRQMIMDGNVKEANKLLGRFFEVSGDRHCRPKKRGHTRVFRPPTSECLL